MSDGAVVHTVELEQGSLAYRRWDPSGGTCEQPALVLLHGFTGSSASWHDVAPRLTNGRAVYAFDLPGHGLTELGTGEHPCDMAAFTRALDATLTALELDAYDLLGYSLGGRTGLFFALHSSRPPGRLILESASAGLEHSDECLERQRSDEALAQFALSKGIEAFVDRWEQTPILAAQAQLAAPVFERLRAGRMACTTAGLAMSLRGMGTGAQPWLGDDLAQVATATLLVVGARDRKFCGVADNLCSRLPDARTQIIEDAGHSVHLDAPTSYLQTINTFLASPGRRRKTSPAA